MVLKVLSAFQGKALEAAGERAANAALEVHADSFGLQWGRAGPTFKNNNNKANNSCSGSANNKGTSAQAPSSVGVLWN